MNGKGYISRTYQKLQTGFPKYRTYFSYRHRLRDEVGDGFPSKVTAFHPGMAVLGRFGKPRPACGVAVQRIVYAANECNYYPGCQTGGKLLADRALSSLLRKDWPKCLDEWETHLEARRLPRSSGEAG
jgi:formamidopyrimidine-DNA glycosylase